MPTNPPKTPSRWSQTSERGKLGIVVMVVSFTSLVINLLSSSTYDENLMRQEFEKQQDEMMQKMMKDIQHGRPGPSSDYELAPISRTRESG